ARDSGGIAISNKVKLPEEDAAQVQAGYRMYLAVYQPGRSIATVAGRRDAIAGWIYAAFSMVGLMDNILGERTNIDVEVQDGGVGQGDELLTDTLGDRVGGESAVKLFISSQRVEVGGYSWTLTARSLPNFATPVALSKLQLVARVGAAASLLLAFATWYLLRRRIRNLRADEDLRAAKERAESASLAKTRFLAAASHDLRQPIQALSLFVATLQAMARRAELPGPEVAHIASRLQLALHGLGRLLNGLFELSGLENGVVTVSKQPVSLADLLADLNTTFAGPAQAKGLALRMRAPRGLWVDTDRVMLLRVLSNLVSNALRYTNEGGVLVGCRRRGGQVEIQVLDTGIGIAAGEIAKVFTEFYQPSDVVRDREHGMGLGLAIVQRTAALLGATVQLRSVPGKGSVFSVTMPLLAAKPAGEPVGQTAPVPRRVTGSVLLIDDDAEIRESMRRLLLEWGHEVLVAATIDEAVACAAAPGQAIALILSDYQLAQGVSGVDAILAVQQRLGREVPCVLITGDTSPGPAAQAEHHGYPLLYKPVEPDALARLTGHA
ncbi:MAG: ATP-binding protein, partial [Ramlibacter sp.]